MTRTGQEEQESQNRTGRPGQAEMDRQNRTAVLYRKNWTKREEHAELNTIIKQA
jgi:hypothetical protein